MKRLLSFFFLAQVSLPVFSQIPISAFPDIGDTLIFRAANLNIPFAPVDISGTGQVWDWNSYVQYQSTIDTLIVYSPAQYAESVLYPDADFIITRSSINTEFWNSVEFYKEENNEVLALGNLVSPDESVTFIPIVNQNPITFFSFPIALGNSFRDTIDAVAKLEGSLLGMPYDSMMQVRRIYRHDTVDGSGQLLVPGYTFNNMLRNKISDIYIDSVFSYTAGSGWSLFETKTREMKAVFWHRADNFLAAWAEVRNDTLFNFYSPIPPPPSVRLEFVNLPSQVVEGEYISPFEVRAFNKSDNSLATGFNDSVFIFQQVQTPHSFSGMGAALAQNGVAVFSNSFFIIPGTYSLIATSVPDTLDDDTLAVTVVPAPDHIQINNLQQAAAGELLPPFQAVLYNTLGAVDLQYQGEIHLGKLSGSGKLSGTLVKQAVNGIAVFDDISINHEDQYNLIAWIVSDGANNAALLDSEYVTITPNPGLTWGPAGTDTLSEYVDRATFFVWTGNADGFLSGTSREWYDEIGQHFDFSQKGLLTKVIFYAADYYQVNNLTNDTYKVKIYNSGVSLRPFQPVITRYVVDSLCLDLLGEQTFTHDDFHTTDFFIRTPTVVTFNTPVQVYSDFIVALEVNNENSDDTLIIWTSPIGDGNGEHRTMRHIIDNYPGFNSGWIHDNDWRPQYDVDLMIMPVIELDTADIITGLNDKPADHVIVYPNPARGAVSVSANERVKQVSIFDLSGRMVYSYHTENGEKSVVIAPGNIAAGLYTLEISFFNSSPVKKKLLFLEP